MDGKRFDFGLPGFGFLGGKLVRVREGLQDGMHCRGGGVGLKRACKMGYIAGRGMVGLQRACKSGSIAKGKGRERGERACKGGTGLDASDSMHQTRRWSESQAE
eukprot:357752-Chlamydomonas_euryale.AAC.5